MPPWSRARRAFSWWTTSSVSSLGKAMTASATTETSGPIPSEGGVAASVGRTAFEAIESARDIYGVLVRTLYYVARARTDRGAVVRQMYEIGNRSVFLLTVVIGFIGM